VLDTDKKTGKIRFCTDYRDQDAVTTFQSYKIPRIEDVLDALAGSSCFYSIDLIRGTWQIKMCETDGSDLKTAFATKEGALIYKHMKVASHMDDLTPHRKTRKRTELMPT
jgi:hypothetical protein